MFTMNLGIDGFLSSSVQDFSWMCIPFTLKTLQNAAAVYWDKNVYFLGGSYTTIPERGLSCYNIQQDSWLLKSGLPLPRINLAACVTQGIIYTSGGTTEREYLDVV